MTLHLDFNFLGEAFIVRAEDCQDLIAAKVIGNIATVREHLPQLCPGKDNTIFLVMRAGPKGCHTVALVAIECPIDL